ncbi:MAG: magnesium-translocating P-type ATPase [Rickettsiales bacterium]|jgi:Mg2+-importing ATPase|nr:magnesium-translocating P-type ATPase [Rickettsiales bacterium]
MEDVMEKEIQKKQRGNLSGMGKKLLEYAKMDPYYLLKELKSDLKKGLDTEYVEEWQDKSGFNEIAGSESYSWYKSLLESFFNPFNIVLMILAAISFITKDGMAAVTISFLVIVSSLIKFIQENKSNSASEKLKSMIKTTATTLRDSKKKEIDITQLVVGDIIFLSAGDIVPADLRVIESKDLFISQSSLTGESEPIEKFSELDKETLSKLSSKQPIELGDLCFMGTNVVSGTATAVILSIGTSTYFGSMVKLITKKKTKTNFDKGLSEISLFLIKFMLIMVIIVFFINGLSKHNWVDAFLFAISIAVGLTPEMLPVIVSTNLAKGAVSMSKKRTIVKNINSIQNFGAMDVLCSDKTGTLTENVVVLQYHLNIHGKEDLRILRHAYLNSNFQTGLKNLLDLAIIDKALDNSFYNINFEYKKIDELPFDFMRRRMSVILEDKSGKIQMITKGAIEEMLQICKFVEYNGVVIELDNSIKQEVLNTVLKLNNEGMRVLAIAQKSIPTRNEQITNYIEKDMVLMGYLSFLDPPKQSSKSAIAALKENNVKIKVLTGDSDIIAKHVCRKVGIENDKVLLGSEIDEITDKELKEKVENIDIFAKLSPQQKLRIIKVLRECGHTVGFMGDGINDAPAMREADVAISVDSAVDVAKESADIILLKKDLNVLVDGVLEGRKIFCNILKYIKMTISSNFGNIFSILFASLFLPFLPMLPVQILILNILYDVSQISIPWDNVDEDYLKTQKKWSSKSVKSFMLNFGPISSVCDIMLFLIMSKLLKWDMVLFNSGWFVASMITQVMVIHFIRTDKKPFIESSASFGVVISTLVMTFIAMLLPYVKIGGFVGLAPVPLLYYIYLFFVVVIYIVLIQLNKRAYIKKNEGWL